MTRRRFLDWWGCRSPHPAAWYYPKLSDQKAPTLPARDESDRLIVEPETTAQPHALRP